MDTAQEARGRSVPLAWALPAWRGWPSVRDSAIAAATTVIAVAAAYGEAHPTDPRAYFTGGHHLPHTPDAALLLVAAGGAVLAWRHLYPRAVLACSTAAVVRCRRTVDLRHAAVLDDQSARNDERCQFSVAKFVQQAENVAVNRLAPNALARSKVAAHAGDVDARVECGCVER